MRPCAERVKTATKEGRWLAFRVGFGRGHSALGQRLGQGQAREAGTEKSGVSGISLSRAASSIAYVLAGTSGTGVPSLL